MARCLIVGCGCRGLALGRELLTRGHTVRGTTRRSARARELEAAGIEAVVADPDRLATLTPALEHVSVACLLLGSATGPADSLAVLHGTRLETLLRRMIDTTVRGIVYETAGDGNAELLGRGADRVRGLCEDSRILYLLLSADPREPRAWLEAALDSVQRVLGAR